jgi:hypothetical protein
VKLESLLKGYSILLQRGPALRLGYVYQPVVDEQYEANREIYSPIHPKLKI